MVGAAVDTTRGEEGEGLPGNSPDHIENNKLKLVLYILHEVLINE